jgi:hypothetical protein
MRVVCRLRARFLSMGRTLLSRLGLGRFRRILELTFSNYVSELLDRRRTESKDDDRSNRHNHVIPP